MELLHQHKLKSQGLDRSPYHIEIIRLLLQAHHQLKHNRLQLFIEKFSRLHLLNFHHRISHFRLWCHHLTLWYIELYLRSLYSTLWHSLFIYLLNINCHRCICIRFQLHSLKSSHLHSNYYYRLNLQNLLWCHHLTLWYIELYLRSLYCILLHSLFMYLLNINSLRCIYIRFLLHNLKNSHLHSNCYYRLNLLNLLWCHHLIE